MTNSSTTVVGAKSEFLTNFGNDWLGAKAKEDNVIAFMKRDNKAVVREVQVGGDIFEYEGFDVANLTRQNTRNSSRGDTRYYDKERTMIAASLGQEFRFGARYTPSDMANRGISEADMQNDKTIEAVQQTSLDYNINLASVFNSGTKTQAVTGGVWTPSSGDPVNDFRVTAEAFRANALGLLPTDAIIGFKALQALRTNDSFRAYVKGDVNSGIMGLADVETALEAIIGRKVRVHISSQAYNAAQPDNLQTVTFAEAWTASSIYLWRRGEDGVRADVSGVTQFYIPDQEGVFVNGIDPDNDAARNLTTVVSKLKRRAFVTADAALIRLTGVVA